MSNSPMATSLIPDKLKPSWTRDLAGRANSVSAGARVKQPEILCCWEPA
jgi:hypothetical protein